tara:strand:- start:266 stop:517 length:252 start_codon:yes stop_codon:yes gene_type:complete
MKKLTNLEATMIAEGEQEPESDEQYIQAWQHLIDTGLAWSLQGFFGRTASTMIQQGLCYVPIKKQPKKLKSTGGQTPRTPEEK